MTTEMQATSSTNGKSTKAVKTLRDMIDARSTEIAKLLPKHLTVERLANTAALAMSRTPMLEQCTPLSLFRAVMLCAEIGLEPTGTYGGVHLVPFRNNKTNTYEVTPIIDYRGLLDLARRSGQISRIEAHVVYANDRFKLRYGIDPVLEHTPALQGEPGPIIGAYAVALLKDGGTQVEFMPLRDLDAIKKRSKAASSGPWVSDTGEMYRKTVLRRLCKFLPRSIEMRRAEEVEDEVEGPVIDVISDSRAEVQESPSGSKTTRLKGKLAAALPPKAEVETVQDESAPSAEEMAEIQAAESVDATTGEVLS